LQPFEIGLVVRIKERPPKVAFRRALADGYFVPLDIKPGASEAELRLVERTPSRMTLGIWDGRVLPLLDSLLAAQDLDPAERARLQPIVELRRKVGRIDEEIAALQEQRTTLDQRAEETRESLDALKKDPKAGALRKRLGERLEQLTAEADALGRRVVELQSQRLEAKIALEDQLESLEL
jgi:prefoldin subunit 5